jgi:hypothetical protein
LETRAGGRGSNAPVFAQRRLQQRRSVALLKPLEEHICKGCQQ